MNITLLPFLLLILALASSVVAAEATSLRSRWIEFSELTDEQKSIATEGLNYTKETWNNLGTNPIEASEFFDLSDEQKKAAKQLGFIGATWDCDMNHYVDYSWEELEEYFLDAYWIALGWTKRKWGIPGFASKSEGKNWSELTSAEQDAAMEVCYFQESWDGISITGWTFDGPNPNKNLVREKGSFLLRNSNIV